MQKHKNHIFVTGCAGVIGFHLSQRLLNDLIKLLEEQLGRKVIKQFLPIQSGDVLETFADINDLVKDINFKPTLSIEEGIKRFIKWYKEYDEIS